MLDVNQTMDSHLRTLKLDFFFMCLSSPFFLLKTLCGVIYSACLTIIPWKEEHSENIQEHKKELKSLCFIIKSQHLLMTFAS